MVKEDNLWLLWPFCSAEHIGLYNFARGHNEEHVYENILNFDQSLRRRYRLTIYLILALVAIVLAEKNDFYMLKMIVAAPIMRRSRKKYVSLGKGVLTTVFGHQHISESIVRTSLEKQLGPRGPISTLEGSALDILRKPIATCDFQGRSGPPAPSPLWVHGTNLFFCYHCKSYNRVKCTQYETCANLHRFHILHISRVHCYCTITCILRNLFFWTC